MPLQAVNNCFDSFRVLGGHKSTFFLAGWWHFKCRMRFEVHFRHAAAGAAQTYASVLSFPRVSGARGIPRLRFRDPSRQPREGDKGAAVSHGGTSCAIVPSRRLSGVGRPSIGLRSRAGIRTDSRGTWSRTAGSLHSTFSGTAGWMGFLGYADALCELRERKPGR